MKSEVFKETIAGVECLRINPGSNKKLLLLHGFPQSATSLLQVASLLPEEYEIIIPFMRGYTPRADARRVLDLSLSAVAREVGSLLEEIGPAHVIGHDLGGATAWVTAVLYPRLTRSLTSISMPHPTAFVRSLGGIQAIKSLYVLPIMIPGVPELIVRGKGGHRIQQYLQKTGLSVELAHTYVKHIQESIKANISPFNWYRAFPLSLPFVVLSPIVKCPTLLIWSTGDSFVTKRSMELSRTFVDGEVHISIIQEAPHWLPEECPEETASRIASFLAHLDGETK